MDMAFHRLAQFTGRALVPALLGSALLAACGGGQSDAGPDSKASTTSTSTADSAARAKAQGGDVSETALTPVRATSSATERGDLSADKAIDHDDNTRWGSAFSDDQHLTLDYGTAVDISRVQIHGRTRTRPSTRSRPPTTARPSPPSRRSRTAPAAPRTSPVWPATAAICASRAWAARPITATRSSRSRPSPARRSRRSPRLSSRPIRTSPPNPPRPTATQPARRGDQADGGGCVQRREQRSGRRQRGRRQHVHALGQPGGGRRLAAVRLRRSGQPGLHEAGLGERLRQAYQIQVSDDGKTWKLLRDQQSGKGGTEEYYNLGVKTRYVRMQGQTRATAYGYSLFEVEFKSIGSDNSIPVSTTTPFPAPANNTVAALFQPQAPIETLQFTLPDGTLVTRFGQRGVGRHGRERGEDWNEIGFGPNETVDANGNPVDKGPGNYMNFVANYFRNRTWGVEFIDNSRVPGVTKPRLIVNQYFQEPQRGGGHSFFRRIDDPHVTATAGCRRVSCWTRPPTPTASAT
ncbi:f5/8 type C domain-containing protein [Ditylenchus destructor]|nr:f5/8 type C domain-containing protein [Ditylenchus destructor]